MYSLLTGLWAWWNRKPEFSVLTVGLDGGGKTTILEKVKSLYGFGGLPPDKIHPTVGFNSCVAVCKMAMSDVHVNIWDVGGQVGLRSLWEQYYADADGLIFVVDMSAPARFDEAKNAFELILTEPALANRPILLLLNKMDRAGDQTEQGVVAQLSLDTNPRWISHTRGTHVHCVNALTGAGVRDSLNWLIHAIRHPPDTPIVAAQ